MISYFTGAIFLLDIIKKNGDAQLPSVPTAIINNSSANNFL